MTSHSCSRAVQVDTRQQAGKHNHMDEWLESHGVLAIRSKLAFGDYALVPPITVDTKKDIYELAGDIDQQHERFRNEQKLAQDAGSKLVILVENEDGVTDLADLAQWEEPAKHFMMRKRRSSNPNTRKISGERLAKACVTMERKYGTSFMFCTPEQRPQLVYEILTGGETIEET